MFKLINQKKRNRSIDFKKFQNNLEKETFRFRGHCCYMKSRNLLFNGPKKISSLSLINCEGLRTNKSLAEEICSSIG